MSPSPLGQAASEAVLLLLARHPGRNEEAFAARFPDPAARRAVQALIDEAARCPRTPLQGSLIGISEEVRAGMARAHPELSEAALRKLGNAVTYLLR